MSRFKEHFDFTIEQDSFQDDYSFYNSNNTSKTSYNSPQLYMEQDDDIRRQSLSNTIGSLSSHTTNCNLKRQSRVQTRRRQRQNSNGSLSTHSSHNTVIGWCLKQKSKLSSKLRHL